MGIPGVHLGEKHGSKASHLMIVRHTEDGPITFNEMLPSSVEEMADLEKRLVALDSSQFKRLRIMFLFQNVVKRLWRRQKKDGMDPLGDISTMTIRDYLVQVITKMPEDIRNGRPGYVLKDASDIEVSRDPVAVRNLIDTLYDGENMKTFKAIQPPTDNSQFVSHIHCFQLPDGIILHVVC